MACRYDRNRRGVAKRFRYDGFSEYDLNINGVWEHHNLYSIIRERAFTANVASTTCDEIGTLVGMDPPALGVLPYGWVRICIDWHRVNNDPYRCLKGGGSMSGALPRVLVVSIPKGGTNLLLQVILGIPGMQQIRRNMVVEGQLTPIEPGEMGVMHLPYDSKTEELLNDHKVKIVLITRDPRDIAVSLMHFILNGLPSHMLHLPFTQALLTTESRLKAIITGLSYQHELSDTVLANELLVAHGGNHYPNIDEFISPFLPWLSSPNVCHVTYEELADARNAIAAVGKIVDFLWGDLSKLGIPKGLLATQMLRNINPAVSPTFRAGRVGDWRKEFTEENKEQFKRVAGERLIELGYESDFSW